MTDAPSADASLCSFGGALFCDDWASPQQKKGLGPLKVLAPRWSVQEHRRSAGSLVQQVAMSTLKKKVICSTKGLQCAFGHMTLNNFIQFAPFARPNFTF